MSGKKPTTARKPKNRQNTPNLELCAVLLMDALEFVESARLSSQAATVARTESEPKPQNQQTRTISAMAAK